MNINDWFDIDGLLTGKKLLWDSRGSHWSPRPLMSEVNVVYGLRLLELGMIILTETAGTTGTAADRLRLPETLIKEEVTAIT